MNLATKAVVYSAGLVGRFVSGGDVVWVVGGGGELTEEKWNELERDGKFDGVCNVNS